MDAQKAYEAVDKIRCSEVDKTAVREIIAAITGVYYKSVTEFRGDNEIFLNGNKIGGIVDNNGSIHAGLLYLFKDEYSWTLVDYERDKDFVCLVPTKKEA
jgi:hypothetical protein